LAHRAPWAGHAQAVDQSGSLAVAVREAHPQPLAFRATTVAADHIGRGPGFVDEDQALRFEIELTLKLIMTLLQDFEAILLYRMACLFCASVHGEQKNDVARQRKRPCRPPSPARILKQKSRTWESSHRFRTVENSSNAWPWLVAGLTLKLNNCRFRMLQMRRNTITCVPDKGEL